MTRVTPIRQADLARVWKAARDAKAPLAETLIEPDGTARILYQDKADARSDAALENWIADS